jgi:catalase
MPNDNHQTRARNPGRHQSESPAGFDWNQVADFIRNRWPTSSESAPDGIGLVINRAAPNAPSVIYDAVFIPAGVGPGLASDTLAQRFVHEAYRHGKPIAVATDAAVFLEIAQVPRDAAGVIVGDGAEALLSFVEAIGNHRFPRRVSVLNPS